MANDDKKEFADALDAMDAGDVFTGKYGDGSADSAPSQPDKTTDEDRKRIRQQREVADFESWVGNVDKIEDPNQRVSKSSLQNEFAALLAASNQADGETPSPLIAYQEPPPTAFEDVPADSPVLNLRKIPTNKAISKLGVYVDFAKRDGKTAFKVVYSTDGGVNEFDIERWLETVGAQYNVMFKHAGHIQCFDIRIG